MALGIMQGDTNSSEMFLRSWFPSLLISIMAVLGTPVKAVPVKQALSLHSAHFLNKLEEKSSVGKEKGNAMYPIPFNYSQKKAEGKTTLRSHLACPLA